MESFPDVVELATRLVRGVEDRGVQVRLIGGVGVRVRCGADTPTALARPLSHIDLISEGRSPAAIRDALVAMGFVVDREVEALHGTERQVFYDESDNRLRVDLFIGRFRLCHELDLTTRLQLEPLVIPAAELLMTKLQIADPADKDLQDTAALLLTHRLGDRDGPRNLNLERVQEMVGTDWGLYTTAFDNLARLEDGVDKRLGARDLAAELERPVAAIRDAFEAAPRSVAWRARARIGRSKRWYALPDEMLEPTDELPLAVPLRAVHLPSAHEVVLDHLRRALHAGDFVPGERLPGERTLADTFGVSRKVVHQAIHALQTEGLIETRRGRSGGPFVAPWQTPAVVNARLPQIDELIDFRLGVEPRTAALAAEHRSRSDLQTLYASVGELARSDEPGIWRRADASFHIGLATASRNSLLLQSIEGLRGIEHPLQLWPTGDQLRSLSVQEHRLILEAVASRDSPAAEQAMVRHLESVRQQARQLAHA